MAARARGGREGARRVAGAAPRARAAAEAAETAAAAHAHASGAIARVFQAVWRRDHAALEAAAAEGLLHLAEHKDFRFYESAHDTPTARDLNALRGGREGLGATGGALGALGALARRGRGRGRRAGARPDGLTPLALALALGAEDVARTLVRLGSPVDRAFRTARGDSLLHLSARGGVVGFLDDLRSAAPSAAAWRHDLRATARAAGPRSRWRSTAASRAPRGGSSRSATRRAGYGPAWLSPDGDSLLHLARARRHRRRRCCARSSTPRPRRCARGRFGNTPVGRALFRGREHTVRALLRLAAARGRPARARPAADAAAAADDAAAAAAGRCRRRRRAPRRSPPAAERGRGAAAPRRQAAPALGLTGSPADCDADASALLAHASDRAAAARASAAAEPTAEAEARAEAARARVRARPRARARAASSCSATRARAPHAADDGRDGRRPTR